MVIAKIVTIIAKIEKEKNNKKSWSSKRWLLEING
jgi:hypothetical protein